jgi:uncharacterized BrkB/YihY/UPF0761 family membrane protein
MAATDDSAPVEETPAPRSKVARAKAQIDAGRARIDSARGSVPAVDTAFVVYERDRHVSGNLLACAVAYRMFLWFLPLSLLIAAVLGFVQASDEHAPADAAESVGMSSYMAKTVADAASQASRSRWVLLIVAVWALYSASSGGARTMRAISCIAWGIVVSRPKHTWAAALAFAGCALGLISLVGATNWLKHNSPGLGLTSRLLMFFVFAGAALLVSLLLPHRDVAWYWLLPGALLTAVGVQILHLITVFYLAGKLDSSSQLYGGLGAAATILLWLYLLGRLVVGSAVLNATLWERYHKPEDASD